jgi:hypothetical protein
LLTFENSHRTRGNLKKGFILKSYKLYRNVLLISVVGWMFAIVQPCQGLVISEVMYHPSDETESLEFIELYNNQATSEDLGGFSFTKGVQYTFPVGTLLGPKSYLVVARDPNALQAAYGIEGVYGPFTGRLDNNGERIELSNANGGVFLSMVYRDSSPWPVAPDGTGHSLILSKLAGDPDEGSSYASSTFIGGTPGGPDETQATPEPPTQVTLIGVGHIGRYFKGTAEPSPGPAGEPTTAWTAITFADAPGRTQWQEGPSGYGYSNDPAELQYIGTQLNDMYGGYLSIYARLRFTLTAEQIAQFSQLSAEVHYDDAFVLYLNGVRVLDSGYISGDPPAHDQAASQATDPPAISVDLTDRVNLLVPGTNVLAVQVHNASLSGSSDCLICPILRATLETSQVTQTSRTRLAINELQAASGESRIELYNPGPLAMSLDNIYLSDDPRELLTYKVPAGIHLQPGQFWVAQESLSGDGLPFALDVGGGTVYVTASSKESDPKPSRVLDAVRYGPMESSQTFGRFPDGAQRTDFLTTATFGAHNAQPQIGPIVINEIMYHHPTEDERYEYIELYNRSSTTVSLAGWALTDGVDYAFEPTAQLAPHAYVVVAYDPNFLAQVYSHLHVGSNLVGPYSGSLNDHSDRIQLSRPVVQMNPQLGRIETYMVTADEVTYYDGGRWPLWTDGEGASLELRDPNSDNCTPDAWAASDESDKSTWQSFSTTISGSDSRYTHDAVGVFDCMLLHRGEVLLDDLALDIGGRDRLTNGGFEDDEANWRILGNHRQSFVTSSDPHSGSQCLYLVAGGHGDPGANRINQSIPSINASTVTFRGYARWLRGSQFLLLRVSRSLAPVQPPRPACVIHLDAPLNLGTPGLPNTAFALGRGPDILDVHHSPVLPSANEPIVVTAHVVQHGELLIARLGYQFQGQSGSPGVTMVDDGSGDDAIAGDGIFTGTIPGAPAGTMVAFNIMAFSGGVIARFPAQSESSPKALTPECMVRVGDTLLDTVCATYRIWLSDEAINAFRTRPNLSNEMIDCTFVYNDTEVFYDTQIRFRASPFLRPGSGWDVRDGHAYRLEFNPDQTFRGRREVNLDNTEGSSRGPLQERASYWFYRQMGLSYSTHEFIRPIINGRAYGNYEDVQVLNSDYIQKWFPNDSEGYLHKIDDYFEYAVDGTSYVNLDEGLKSDAQHPALSETYRWGFEKRSHAENDTWNHLFTFAALMNVPSTNPGYEGAIESVIHPEHLAKTLAIRHAVGDWDSYGYTRGKNNYFYYATSEHKWYLLPWDIDFTLGSGDGAYTNVFTVTSGEFPEVYQFVNYPKYHEMYIQTLRDLVDGPWQTSYGTTDPPTAFDQFLDDAAAALIADGLGSDRRDGIKQFVHDRRGYLLTQIGLPPTR